MIAAAAIFLVWAVLCIGIYFDEWEPDEDEREWTDPDRNKRRLP